VPAKAIEKKATSGCCLIQTENEEALVDGADMEFICVVDIVFSLLNNFFLQEVSE
jgi:hypothetical protein